MWKCKKCEGEIIRNVWGNFNGVEKNLDKYGVSLDTEVMDLDVTGGEYYCDDCGKLSRDIEDIADWIDE